MLKKMIFHSFLVTGMLVLAACGKSDATPTADAQNRPHPVKIVKVEQTSAPIPIESSGKLASEAEMLLSFKIGGVVDRILVNEGQTVSEGQLLAHLNLTEIDARVRQAKNAFEKAERDMARVKDLLKDSVATLEQYQNASTGYEVAQADYEIAKFNQRYAKIIAPASGQVLRRFVERGELINPGMPAMQIGTASASSQIIRIGVSDRDVVRLAPGDTAQVRFDAYPGAKFSGYVTEIAAAADPKTGTFEVELTLEPSKLLLKNGFVGKVKLFPAKQSAYYRIPMSALVDGSRDLVSIMIPVNERTSARKITVRPEHVGTDYFTVLASEAGKIGEVITDGAAYVRDGETISLVGNISEIKTIAEK